MMSLAAILMWLWMAGQSSSGSGIITLPTISTIEAKCAEDTWISIATPEGNYDKIAICHGGYYHRLAAETVQHVVEIRTKREDNGPAYDIQGTDLSTLHFHDCVFDDAQTIAINRDDDKYHCMKVAKTLWIDGVEFGVIREVEEK